MTLTTDAFRGGVCTWVRAVALAGAVLLSGGAAHAAQTDSGATAGGAPVLSKVLDGMLSNFEGDVMRVANAMPADKYSFAPSQAIFVPSQKTKFDGVRTFAGQCIHLAQANYYFYGQVGGSKPTIDVKGLSSLKSKDEVVKALADSFAFAHQAIATITTDNAMDQVQGSDPPMTKATLATYGVAHGFDHYGQMVVYLRMNGIAPPPPPK